MAAPLTLTPLILHCPVTYRWSQMSSPESLESRLRLNSEWHARPVATMPAPFRCTHQVIKREDKVSDSHAAFAEICARYRQPGPSADFFERAPAPAAIPTIGIHAAPADTRRLGRIIGRIFRHSKFLSSFSNRVPTVNQTVSDYRPKSGRTYSPGKMQPAPPQVVMRRATGKRNSDCNNAC